MPLPRDGFKQAQWHNEHGWRSEPPDDDSNEEHWPLYPYAIAVCIIVSLLLLFVLI